MRNVPVVARRDCAAYFRTPAGLAVLALFLALQGLVFWMFVQFLGRPGRAAGRRDGVLLRRHDPVLDRARAAGDGDPDAPGRRGAAAAAPSSRC